MSDIMYYADIPSDFDQLTQCFVQLEKTTVGDKTGYPGAVVEINDSINLPIDSETGVTSVELLEKSGFTVCEVCKCADIDSTDT
jgi:hypothetical protein